MFRIHTSEYPDACIACMDSRLCVISVIFLEIFLEISIEILDGNGIY